MGNIITVGSMNMDFVYYVRSHPLPGETVHSVRTETKSGGKGANQAVAAKLSGANVTMVGALGKDPYSEDVLAGLRGYGVDTSSIVLKKGTIGTAFITVDESGQNSIVLNGGANALLTVQDLECLPSLFEPSSVVLLQNEIPWDCTQYVIETAYRRGVSVCLNPAPALTIPPHLLPLIDIMVLNETEAAWVTGVKVEHDESAVRQAASSLIRSGVKEVILTLGAKGSFYMNEREEVIHTPAFKVNVEDTTAAGDTFIGSFLAARQKGLRTESCLRWASAASAIAVSRAGAQSSIPDAEEVAAFLKSNA
ncbi:ribokinase [Paenibacillus allorhizosphaerae]|uniref:Ribokinase n=1 Tax=Paenibacillus allorhizosphaerae TaxID=2849866 RepID=A0ABN7TMH5_9BACL|nr:ribokinase [Paenibacillus allorhizosphaerae]CAG7647181.1 Bifunctional ribokinase/ribose-5-phosphate isomerase A [Paenibacillus allorhizosphaerae]